MSYVQNALADGEVLLRRARVHWILWARAWAALIVLGILIYGIYFFIKEAVRLATIEVALTDRRVVRKTGFFNQHVMDIQLRTIEAVNVDQDLFGRLLGYGRVTLHGTGDDAVVTPLIAHPNTFRRAVEAAMRDLSHDAPTRAKQEAA